MTVTLVVDASVAIKWVVEEEHRDLARDLLAGKQKLLAPDFLMIEVANVLQMKVSRGQMPGSNALEALATIGSAFVELVPDRDLAADALQIALELQHPAYDCVYLACAVRRDADFVTADERLLGKLRRVGGWPRVRALNG